MASNLPTDLHLMWFPVVHFFLDHCKNIFRLSDFQDQISELARAVYKIATFESVEMRACAGTLLYHTAKTDFLATGIFEMSQLALTTPFSRAGWLEGLKPTEVSRLAQVINAIMPLYEIDPIWGRDGESDSGTFKTGLSELLRRVQSIFKDTLEIARQRNLGDTADFAVYESLVIHMATVYSHIPEINVDWLEQLAKHHEEHNNYAEAGQCLIQVAELVHSRILGRDGSVLTAHAPDVQSEAQTRVRRAGDYTQGRVVATLAKACELLDKAELYEQCNEVTKPLISWFEKMKLYPRLSSTHGHLKDVFDKLITADATQSRLLGTYYRVGFYGTKFGADLD
eukprot:14632_1